MKRTLLTFLILSLLIRVNAQLQIDQWTEILVDANRKEFIENDFMKEEYLCTDACDASRHGYRTHFMNRDGYKDILSGNYYYRNPGGSLTGNWERFEFLPGVSGLFFTNVNDDDIDDIIAVSGSDVYWYEVVNQYKKMFNVYKTGSIPESDHLTGYGSMADVFKGGKPELLIMGGEGLYVAEIPAFPDSSVWEFVLIAETRTLTDFDVADINGNGFQDIICALPSNRGSSGEFDLVWFENPGKKYEKWSFKSIGTIKNPVSGIKAVDLNGNGKPEIIVAEKSVVWSKPLSDLMVFSMPENRNLKKKWPKKTLGHHFSINTFETRDLNSDGKIDIALSDFKDSNPGIYVYLNDGNGNFRMELINAGVNVFPGVRIFDLDSDDDMDLVGFGGDDNRKLVILRNDAKQNQEIGKPCFVVYDDTCTITEASRGFYRFQPSLVAGNDWTSPFNFYNGTMYARYEVIEYPTDEPFQLQFCIWSEVKEGRFTPGNWKEMCSTHTDVNGVDLATDFVIPSEMWRLNPDEPCDFSQINNFRFMAIVVRCGNRKNCTDMVPAAKGCWEQRHFIYPFKVRFSLVALAEGETFPGWENYIDENRFRK